MAVFYILAPFDPIPGEPGYPARFATLKLAIEAMGHRCIWWTSSWDHASKSEREEAEHSSDIRLLKVPGYASNISFARLRNHRLLAEVYEREVDSAVKSGALPPPDLQLITIPPLETTKAAFSIREQHGGLVVIDVMDRWPDTFFQVLPLPSKKLRAIAGEFIFMSYRKMLRQALKGCDAGTAQSTSFIEWAESYGLGDQPHHVCYLGADLLHEAQVRAFAEGETLRLAYIGAMGTSYDLETVFYALRQLVQKGRKVFLDVAGAGSKEAWMRDYVEQNDLSECVVFHGYLPKTEAFELLDRSHLGLVPMFPESGVVMPYKACEYAARGLPMVHSLPGELDLMVRKWNAGSIYTAGDVDSLVRSLDLYSDTPEQIRCQSIAVHELARQHFDRGVTYSDMAAFLESILPSK